jgi:NmrA-like family
MRSILVAGATGKQGQALIRALLLPTTNPERGWHIYSLTRNRSSPAAKRLAEKYPSSLSIVEGNLEDRESIGRIFEGLKNDGGIWGVFCVLAFPGMGVDASGEELQGKVCLLFLGLYTASFVFFYMFILKGRLNLALMWWPWTEYCRYFARVQCPNVRLFKRDENGSQVRGFPGVIA